MLEFKRDMVDLCNCILELGGTGSEIPVVSDGKKKKKFIVY